MGVKGRREKCREVRKKGRKEMKGEKEMKGKIEGGRKGGMNVGIEGRGGMEETHER